MRFGGGSSGRGSDEDHINRADKRGRIGSQRDGLTDQGRQARDRDPDNDFGTNDHVWSGINGNGCSSCHSSDPSNPSNFGGHR